MLSLCFASSDSSKFLKLQFQLISINHDVSTRTLPKTKKATNPISPLSIFFYSSLSFTDTHNTTQDTDTTLPCFGAHPDGYYSSHSSSFPVLSRFLKLLGSPQMNKMNHPSHTYGLSLQNSLQGMSLSPLTLHSHSLLQAMVVTLTFSELHLIDTEGSYSSTELLLALVLVLSES